MFPVNGWPLSGREFSFVQSLLKDLEPLGFQFIEEGKQVRFVQSAPAKIASYREFYRRAHWELHKKTLCEKWSLILEFERTYGRSVFISGNDLNLSAINPRLRSVDLRRKASPSARDCAIVDYLRIYQTVASRRSVGRENVYILEDYGHSNRPIMGVLVLASPRFYQPQRDEVLGWASPRVLGLLSSRRQKRLIATRMAGLNRMMQVAICCALPPYSRLGAASLLAMAPFVRSVQEDFQSRWYDRKVNPDPDLVAVTTTTGMSLTGTPFQALYTGMFFDEVASDARGEKWNTQNTLYSRLSDRHPWLAGVRIHGREPHANFLGLLSSDTWNLALGVAGPGIDPKHFERYLRNMSPQMRSKLLRYVMQQVGLSTLIFRGNPMGVFLGAIDRSALEALRDGVSRHARPMLSWEKAIARFKSEFDTQPTDQFRDDPRQQAVGRRARRALETTLEDIRLSSRVEQLSEMAV